MKQPPPNTTPEPAKGLGPQPPRPLPEQPVSGDPFAFRTKDNQRIDVAAGGPFAEALKLMLRETAPLAVDASREALARQEQVLSRIGFQGELPKHAVNINLDRLEDPTQINGLILGVAEELKPQVDEARRGTISNEETVKKAEALFRRDEGFMLRRNVGQAVNAEEITATRFVLASARDRTAELARQIVTGNTSAETLLGFRRSLAQMAAIQLQLHGMAAEAGRALQAFRIDARSGVLDLIPGAGAKGDSTTAPEMPAAAGPSTTAPGGAGAPQPADPAAPMAPAPGAQPGAPAAATPAPGAQPPQPGAPTAPGQPPATKPPGKHTPGSAAAATQDIQALLDLAGGTRGIIDLAQGFLDLPHAAAQNAMARDSVNRGPAEMIGELWYNYVLSGPATHVVNMTGNAITLGTETAERAMAAQWGKLFGFMGRREGVKQGEAAAMMQAYWGAVGDAWRLANFAFRHGESIGSATQYRMPLSTLDVWKMSNADAQKMADPKTAAAPGSKADNQRQPAITGENVLNTGAAAVNAVSRKVMGRDVMNPAALGQRGVLGRMTDLLSLTIDVAGGALRTPTRALGAEDQFWKTLAYRGEASARAWREGIDAGLGGDELRRYVDEAVTMMGPADDRAAENFARKVTMSESLQMQFAQSMQRAGASKFGYLFMPFVRVTSNILDYTTQRVAFPARPQWWREVSSDDPAVRDLALAKASTGGLMWMTAMQVASTGMDADENAPVVVTGAGPKDPQMKQMWLRRGYQEYAVRLGGTDGKWYSYNRLDPAGQMLGIAADSVNLMAKMDEATSEEFAATLVAAIGNNVVNKNYMQSIAEGMEVFTSYDPAMWQKWLQGKAAGFVVPNVLSQIAQAQDPYLRRSVTIAEEITKRASAEGKRSLPLVRDIAGYPIKQEWLFGSRFTGIQVKDSKPDPVAEEILRMELPFSRPSRNLRGVELTEEQYDRYQELAGHALKAPKRTMFVGPAVRVDGKYRVLRMNLEGKGMWEALTELIRSPEYKAATDGAEPPGQRAEMISDLKHMYLDLAQVRMLGEFPELTEQVVTAKGKASTAKGLPAVAVEQTMRAERMTLQRRVSAALDYEVEESTP